jgi:hypothetical protein
MDLVKTPDGLEGYGVRFGNNNSNAIPLAILRAPASTFDPLSAIHE